MLAIDIVQQEQAQATSSTTIVESGFAPANYDFTTILRELNVVFDHDIYTLNLDPNYKRCAITSKYPLERLLKIFQAHARFQKLKEQAVTLSEPIGDDVLNLVATLPFDDFVIERSFSKSLIFKLKFSLNTFLFISVPPSPPDSNAPLALFTLEENRIKIASNYNTLQEIVSGMTAYLNQ